MKELSKNNSLTSPKTIDLSNPDKVNAMDKKRYYVLVQIKNFTLN